MKLSLAALLACASFACTHSPGAGSGSTSCGSMGGACSSDGTTCSPAPIGSGWSHMLQCQGGKWQELEIAPLPTPQPPASQ
jgi:hypothetical protein